MEVMLMLTLLGVPALVILIPQWLRSLERRRILEALAVAAERGASLPAEPVGALLAAANPVRPRPSLPDPVRDHRIGVVLLAVMLGICVVATAVGALIQAAGEAIGLHVGLVIASVGAGTGLIGAAYLLLARGGRRAARSVEEG